MANPEDLGRYRLKRLLGRGTLGEVWEADDLEEQGAKVAVKIMHAADDELALARSHFAREARLASLLRHPHVVSVRDAGEAAGTSFMVMDMVEGRSLRKLLADPATATVTVEEKLRWVREIASALSAMHRVGIVHRDVKPENIIIRADRSACLVDLGIAKWTKFDLGGDLDPERTFVAEAKPTDYVPPETTEIALYDELGDQYAWAVLAYELLTGGVPGLEPGPLAMRDDIRPKVALVLDRARSLDREARWEAMDDAIGAISAEPSTRPPAARTSPLPPPPREVTRRRAATPAVIAVGIVVLVALVLALALR